MMGDCKECGCHCTLCSTNSLDLHHDIEVLKASLKESRHSVNSLKNELKQAQENLEETNRKHQHELSKMAERYERLRSSHNRMETTNHDLEDKILMLVQDYDAEKEATMSIHEDIHKKLKEADKKVEDTIHEKDTLAGQCKVVLDLLKKFQSTNNSNVNGVLSSDTISKEVSRLSRTIHTHEQQHPVLCDDTEELSTPRAMPISTFPPCAMMFDHSPKPMRKHIINKLAMPRNASDSRLANMAAVPTNLKLCSNCKDVRWTRDFSTQTHCDSELLSSLSLQSAAPRSISNKNNSRIFDV